jgi:acetyltransferase-like isoleucine patch superfamily enzyme
MPDPLEQLRLDLVALNERTRSEALRRYARLNPFVENLTDWKERGRAWTGEDQRVTIYASATLIGDVELGHDTWVGPFCLLDGSGGLKVGHHCSISTGAQVLSHDTVRWALSGGLAEYERSATRIGDCCFIGSHSVVLRGVTVGDHCLIGAGAVLGEDAPSHSIYAGVPARRIGTVEVDEGGEVSLVYG